MNQVVLLIGGNIGNRLNYIDRCIKLIEEHIGSIISKSKIYQTAPWGGIDQQDFYNQGILVNTNYSPNIVLDLCLKIELTLDRKREVRWGERTMDIDIIFYNNIIFNTPLLQIPHPRYHLRNFVLYPLVDIIPDYICPMLKKSIRNIKDNCTDDLKVIETENI